jgi:hypothetical protein
MRMAWKYCGQFFCWVTTLEMWFVYKPPNIYPEEFNSASRAAHQYDWTQCQAGFSQHLATIVNDCEINYCARLKPSGITYIPIRSPPFSKKPSDENTTSFHVVSEDGQSWTEIY